MGKKICIIISMIISLILVGCSTSSNLTEEEKLADFEQLYNEIESGYPFLEVNKRLNGQDWLANKAIYEKLIMETNSDKEFISELSLILRDLNNSHTHLIDTQEDFDFFKKTYSPLNWYDFFDDQKVINRYSSIKKGFAYKENSYKDNTIKDLVENEVGYIHIPQMYSANGDINKDMETIKAYLEKIKDYKALVIDIRGNPGGTDEYWRSLVAVISDKTYNCKGYVLFRTDSNVISEYIKGKNAKLNDINDLPETTFKNSPKEVSQMFTSFEYNEDVVKGESKAPFEGKIYLLVDNRVFSAAESFSIFCKEQKFATIIGSKTKGDGYVYDPVLFKLNNSGLIVRMSSAMYLTEDGICNEEEKTTPDILVENTAIHYGEDECIQKALELVDKL